MSIKLFVFHTILFVVLVLGLCEIAQADFELRRTAIGIALNRPVSWKVIDPPSANGNFTLTATSLKTETFSEKDITDLPKNHIIVVLYK